MININIITLILFIGFTNVYPLKLSGSVVTQDSWHIVTRFCFKSYANIYNSIVYTFSKWSAPYLNNLFLFNTSTTVDEILTSPLSCYEKKELAWVYIHIICIYIDIFYTSITQNNSISSLHETR